MHIYNLLKAQPHLRLAKNRPCSLKGTKMDYVIDDKTITVPPVIHNGSEWQAIVNGEDITSTVESLALINRSGGWAVLYGGSMTGRQFNQAHLYNRGGSIIVLHAEKDRMDYILVVDQLRPLQRPTTIEEFPRGQSNLGEKDIATALRELREETGLEPGVQMWDWRRLGSLNPDNALTLYENAHFAVFSLSENEIDWQNMKIREDSFRPDAREDIRSGRLVRMHGFTSPSGYVMAAIGLLRAYLDKKRDGTLTSNDFYTPEEEEEEVE